MTTRAIPVVLRGAGPSGDPGGNRVVFFVADDGEVSVWSGAAWLSLSDLDGSGGGGTTSVLRFAGLATMVGSAPETHFFATDALADASHGASYGPPIPCPDGPRTVQALHVRVIDNTLATTVLLRVYVDGSPTTIVVTVGAGATGAFSDTMHTETLADGQALEVVAETTGGTSPGELLRFTAALAVS